MHSIGVSLWLENIGNNRHDYTSPALGFTLPSNDLPRYPLCQDYWLPLQGSVHSAVILVVVVYLRKSILMAQGVALGVVRHHGGFSVMLVYVVFGILPILVPPFSTA